MSLPTNATLSVADAPQEQLGMNEELMPLKGERQLQLLENSLIQERGNDSEIQHKVKRRGDRPDLQ